MAFRCLCTKSKLQAQLARIPHALSEGERTTLHLYSLLAGYLLENLPAGPLPR
jgi:hypothetical protein